VTSYADTIYVGKRKASLEDLNAWTEYEPECLRHLSIEVLRSEGNITNITNITNTFDENNSLNVKNGVNSHWEICL
jgi:hypothetical protein